MRDRETGRSRGFGFVTYGSQPEADQAIARFVSLTRTNLFPRTNKCDQ